MTDSNAWTEQWFKAQQQFADAWRDMAASGASSSATSQADLWARGFDMWRQASGMQAKPDVGQALNKCLEMGREYMAMAEQVSRSMGQGETPINAINQWLEQMRESLQQMATVPGFNGGGINDFMQQWFTMSRSWEQMIANLLPMNQSAWQLPGMNTSAFNMGEAIDPLGRILSSPGIGYFREPQEKQQQGLRLALEYHQANQAFNQAFLRVATESIQGFQARLMELGVDQAPKSLRGLYDLWVEVSEEHYAEFAMSDEYQSLYGDMVNRLMILKKHYNEINDDWLRAMNLPNTREVDTMQERLQQLRRENVELKREIAEIKAMLQKKAPKATATVKPAARKPATKAAAARKSTTTKAATKKAATRKKSSVTQPAQEA